jgi:hypothetical protein
MLVKYLRHLHYLHSCNIERKLRGYRWRYFYMAVEILPPSIKSIFTVFAVNLSSISYLVEMVEVVEIFFGCNQVIDR